MIISKTTQYLNPSESGDIVRKCVLVVGSDEQKSTIPVQVRGSSMLFVSAQEENNVSEDCGSIQDLWELERLDQIHDARDHSQRDRHVGRDVHKNGCQKEHGKKKWMCCVFRAMMMTACDLSAIAKPWEIQSKVGPCRISENVALCLSARCSETHRGRGSARAKDKLGYKWCFVGASINLSRGSWWPRASKQPAAFYSPHHHLPRSASVFNGRCIMHITIKHYQVNKKHTRLAVW